VSNLVSTLKEEHILKVLENRVLRRIFGPKREDIARGRRKLHSEDLHNLCSLQDRTIKSRRLRWTGHVERTGKVRSA
jgi:hypothetical protein